MPFTGASPGLLPAWLGYPGKQKPTLDGLVCTFSLTFAEFKALSKNTVSENSVPTLDYRVLILGKINVDCANQVEDLAG